MYNHETRLLLFASANAGILDLRNYKRSEARIHVIPTESSASRKVALVDTSYFFSHGKNKSSVLVTQEEYF